MDRRLFLLSAAAMPLYAGPLVTFSETEAKLVTAICDRIIPADDMPGAAAAGVVFYIDKQLAGPLKRFRGAYRAELPKWKAFPDLDEVAQTSFLRREESTSFFQLLIDHTMQGFYGSPQHGGNAGEASWKMLGIDDVMEGHRH